MAFVNNATVKNNVNKVFIVIKISASTNAFLSNAMQMKNVMKAFVKNANSKKIVKNGLLVLMSTNVLTSAH